MAVTDEVSDVDVPRSSMHFPPAPLLKNQPLNVRFVTHVIHVNIYWYDAQVVVGLVLAWKKMSFFLRNGQF